VYAPLVAILNAEESFANTLEGDGLGIFDGVLGVARCAALRDEIDMLHATDKLQDSPNKLMAISSKDASEEEVLIINKPGVRELTLVTTSENEGELPSIDSAIAATPVLGALYEQVEVHIFSYSLKYVCTLFAQGRFLSSLAFFL